MAKVIRCEVYKRLLYRNRYVISPNGKDGFILLRPEGEVRYIQDYMVNEHAYKRVGERVGTSYIPVSALRSACVEYGSPRHMLAMLENLSVEVEK